MYFTKNGNIPDIKNPITIDGNIVDVFIDRVFLLNRKHNVTMEISFSKLIWYQLYSVWRYFMSFRKLSFKTYSYLHFILQLCCTIPTIAYLLENAFLLIICFNLFSVQSLKSLFYVKRWSCLKIAKVDTKHTKPEV